MSVEGNQKVSQRGAAAIQPKAEGKGMNDRGMKSGEPLFHSLAVHSLAHSRSVCFAVKPRPRAGESSTI